MKTKARDIIPAWPRGRSTSQPLAQGSEWPWHYVLNPITGEVLGPFPKMDFIGLKRAPSYRRLEPSAAERRANKDEEERKADMMAMFYMLRLIGGEQASDWPECLFELLMIADETRRANGR
jgi:hypothetical protein